MSFNVTTKMANEFWGDLAIAKSREGSNLLRDYQETIQKFIDQHNLVPASAVEEVALNPFDAQGLGHAILSQRSGDAMPQAATSYLASLGLRIARDAKPVPKLAHPFPGYNADGKLVRAIRCSGCGEMLTGLLDTRWRLAGDHWEHKCGDAQAGHFEARDFGELADDAKLIPADDATKRERDTRVDELGRKVLNIMDDTEGLHARVVALESRNPEPDDAAKRDAKDATIAELVKRIDALEINQGLTKGAIAESVKRVDAIRDGQRKADELINEMRNQILNIADCVDALEADNPEPEAVAAERTFTEEDVRTAVKEAIVADGQSATAFSFAFSFSELLGIDLEANKQAEHDDN